MSVLERMDTMIARLQERLTHVEGDIVERRLEIADSEAERDGLVRELAEAIEARRVVEKAGIGTAVPA